MSGDDVSDHHKRPAGELQRAIGAWQLLAVDGETAMRQMAIDEQLAQQGAPTFRLFRWVQPAISWGFKQRPPAWVDAQRDSACGVELIERPTGGGLAIHGSDLSCSITLPTEPPTHLNDVMMVVCDSLARAAGSFGPSVQWRCDIERPVPIEYCLTEESPYALLIGDKKLCGFAVRRYATSWLIQGSMLVRPLPRVFKDVMPGEVYDMFQHRAIALEDAAGCAIADGALITAMIHAWRATWGVPCVLAPRHARDLELAHAL